MSIRYGENLRPSLLKGHIMDKPCEILLKPPCYQGVKVSPASPKQSLKKSS